MKKVSCLSALAVSALICGQAYAQQTPAIPGTTGTVATDTTVTDEYKAINKAAVAAEDGIEHLKGPAGNEALADLKAGTTVVVRYIPDGTARDSGEADMQTTEGMATKIDGKNNEITVRYDNGKVEKMKLMDRPVADAGAHVSRETRIVSYSSQDTGTTVTHYFTATR